MKLCDYYAVSSDYLLGRTAEKAFGETLSQPCDCGLVQELSETLKKLSANEDAPGGALEYLGAAILKMHDII
jgi:hypothetical protein